MSISLTNRTNELVDLIFSEDDRSLVLDILFSEAADNIPFCDESTPIGMERIRFSILKISDGRLDLFDKAIELAKIDWRDLFAEAEFDHPGDHLKWYNDFVKKT